MKKITAILFASILLTSNLAMAIPAPASDVIKAVFVSNDFKTLIETRTFGSDMTVGVKILNKYDAKNAYAVGICFEAPYISKSASLVEVKLSHTIYTPSVAGGTEPLETVIVETYYFSTEELASDVKACSFDNTSKNP